MRGKYTDALKVGAIVVGLAGVGLGLFLYSGSMTAVAVFALGVPAVLVVAGVVYQRRVTSSETTESPKLRSMAEDLAADVEGLLSTYNRLERSSHWHPGEFADRIRDLGQELDNRGLEVVEEDGGYEVTVERVDMGPGGINRFRQRVDSIQEELIAEYRQYIADQQRTINRQLDRLVTEGLIAEEAALEEPSGLESASLSEVEHIVGERQEGFRDRVWEAINRLRQARGTVSINTSRVDSAIDAGEYEEAVDIVLDARETIEETGQERFERNREELLGLVEDIRSSEAAQYCSRSHLDRLSSIGSTVRSLDSVFQEDQLKDARQETVAVCREIVSDLESQLVEYIDEFNSENVPPDYFERPAVVDRNNVERLQQAEDLANFRQRWETVTVELATALDRANQRRGALRAYADVVPDIEDALSEESEVHPSDIPYDPATDVMEIYDARNPDVTYLENASKLAHSAEIAGGEFDLTVEVELDPPDPETVELDVEGPRDSKQRSGRVEGVETFVFTSLGGGNITVTAAADSDELASVTEDVLLDSDRRIELVLEETTARERLCGDREEETRALLNEVAVDVTRTYQEEGYLRSDMDVGVQDKYAPCLLALWAEEEDLELWESEEGDVLVYDRERVRNQVVNIVDDVLDDGESMDYETIRERYLTIPAPDDLIAAVLTDADREDAVRLTETAVVKE